MKRQLLALVALAAVLVCMCESSTFAANGRSGRGHGHGRGKGISSGFRQHLGNFKGHGSGHGGRFGGFNDGFGLGFGGGFAGGYGWDIAALYRELYGNLPHFALHPPVYYSQPVPRTYGYSPFAYPGYVMTPELIGESGPVEILNPHVPTLEPKQTSVESDKSAASFRDPQPLVVMNPFVTSTESVAQSQ